jgi:PKD repeat protein
VKNGFKLIAAALFCLAMPAALLAQSWPEPHAAGSTAAPRSCPGCPTVRTNDPTGNAPIVVAPTVGFSDPIVAFTGRWLDSTLANDYQAPFRTGRAFNVRYATVGPNNLHRFYIQIGSAVGAYNADTFFTRLQNREPLMTGTSVPTSYTQPRNPYQTEMFLAWNKFFYVENTDTSPWKWEYTVSDIQQRLWGWDVDDRGYVYLAGDSLHWGIAYDDGQSGGGIMTSLFQDKSFDATIAFAFKTTAGRYFVLLGRSAEETMQIWETTNPGSPVKQQRLLSKDFAHMAKTADHAAGVDTNGGFFIYNNDTLFAGGAPQQSFTANAGYYADVTSDGTNFYGVGVVNGAALLISVFSPNGASGTYNRSDYQFSQFYPGAIRAGDGYLAVTSQQDVRLFKLVRGAPTEIDLGGYFNKYYFGPPAGNALPKAINYGALPVVSGSKLYLILSGFRLGDVYELKSEDAISTTVTATSQGTHNPNAPAPNGNLYYGDKVQFLASTSGAQKTVQWNFGNPEATGDPNVVTGATGVPVVHQYSGLTPATLGGLRAVTATDTATGVTGTVNIQLAMPTPRFGMTGSATLFTQADASSSAPIVAGDLFFDASDGDVEGHYAEWTLDGVTNNKKPYFAALPSSYQLDAGGCGAHTLGFNAHYGPYTVDFFSNPDFKVGLNGTFNYTVRPFAAAIFTPPPDASSSTIVFSSLSRASGLTGLQPATLFNYTWELIDAQSVVLQSASSTTPVVVNGIPQFSVDKTKFTSRGIRARLTLTPVIPPLGACANMTSSIALTPALNGPDPIINGGCTNGGPPCSFSAASASGTNTTADGWTYSWATSDPASTLAPDSNKSTYTPTLIKVGTYTLFLSVTNAVGTKTVTTPITVTTAGSTCPLMTANNVYIGYRGPSSACIPFGGNCSTSESVAFVAQSSGYDYGCAPHTFTWDFGDGGSGTGTNTTHAYTVQGTYTVTLTVKNNTQTYTNTASLTVGAVTGGGGGGGNGGGGNGGGGNGGGGGGGGGGSCPTMTVANVDARYASVLNSCNSTTGTGPCKTGEAVTFVVGGLYNFSCATHNFNWNFNDGTFDSGQTVTHTFNTARQYNVSVVVTNTQGGSYTQNLLLTVAGTSTGGGGGGGGPVTGACGAMNDQTVFISYRAPSGCAFNSSTACARGENIPFSASFFLPYVVDCAAHTYTWDFGDGTNGTGRDVTHSYSNSGTYDVKVKVDNGTANFTPHASVVVGTGGTGGSGGSTTPVVDFTSDPLGSLTYKFTPAVDKPNVVTKWIWDFGDGTTLTKTGTTPLAVTYTFANTGSFTVTLTTQNSTGQSFAPVSKVINVTNAPAPTLGRPRRAGH